MGNSGQSVRSLIEGLPPEIANRIHPDWRKNETEYWAQRGTLLEKYADQWIGFAEGRVIVSGTSPVEVFHAAQASGKHPFVTRVGHENEPNRMRRVSFPYDPTYPNEPFTCNEGRIPQQLSTPGLVLEHVIPDTGADASAIPWSDCERLALDPGDGIPGLMGGVGERSIPTYFSSLGSSRRCGLSVSATSGLYW
jgi:hypothetical protein